MDNYTLILIIGLLILIPPFLVGIVGKAKRASEKKKYEDQISSYKDMLSKRMELESEGIDSLKIELNKLKKENENLRISINTFANKPGRKELMKFNAYQNAVEQLCITNPGFASSWHSTVKEIEENQNNVLIGKVPFIKRILPKRDIKILLEEEKKDFS